MLDTTGSMAGLIEGAKQKIWSIANQMASGQPTPEIRVALIGYRDRGDAYVTQRFDLTDDIDGLYGHLQQFQADGGGDTPESVNQALHEAVTQLDWTSGPHVYKVVFLVGDAPPHMNYPDDVAYVETLRVAREAGIVVNTVQAGSMSSTTPVWRTIASSGQGQYVSIAQNGGMIALETPMDEKLAALNRELAEGALAYGSEDERFAQAEKISRSLAAAPAVAASRLSFLDKVGGKAISGRSDLLDAYEAGDADLASLPPEQLPEPLRSLDGAGREAYVQKKVAERAGLKAQIAELARERDDYVKRETERRRALGKGDGFDDRVLSAVREQAASAGIAYE